MSDPNLPEAPATPPKNSDEVVLATAGHLDAFVVDEKTTITAAGTALPKARADEVRRIANDNHVLLIEKGK